MKFIVDAQLPQSLSILLNRLGADSILTLNLPDKNKTGDDVIMKLAAEEDRIITKDNDFLQSQFLKSTPPKLLLVNTVNISKKMLLHLFGKTFVLHTNLFVKKDFIELTKEEIVVHD